jgi:ABC-type multidrug transport system ATPase subunit
VAVHEPPRAPALQDISLSVAEGEKVALMGANGAGKSMLLRVAAGAVAPTRGAAWLDTVLVSEAPGGAVAWMPADPDAGLIGTTVADHLNFFAPNPRRVADVCARFGLDHLRSRGVDSLSAGEKQRVVAAGWWVRGAAVWLLDEPTGWLDPPAARMLRRLLFEELDPHLTVLFATHDWAEAAHADRVAVLHRGRLAFVGSPTEAAGLDPEPFGLPTSPVWATAEALRRQPQGFTAPLTLAVSDLDRWLGRSSI